MPPKIDALILAAGGSSRMGQPKQLLQYQGKSFIEHVCDQVLASDLRHVHLVLGAFHKRVLPFVQDKSIHIHVNPDWEKGMGSSISFGVKSILNIAQATGILILLVDQPLINSQDINMIIENYRLYQKVVVCQSKDSISPPVLITSDHFKALLRLDSDVGAKKYILTQIKDYVEINLGNHTTDIDTPETYRQLLLA